MGLLVVEEGDMLLKPGRPMYEPRHEVTMRVPALRAEPCGGSSVRIMGERGAVGIAVRHIARAWDLSGLSLDELDDLQVAINAQRARGVGVRP